VSSERDDEEVRLGVALPLADRLVRIEFALVEIKRSVGAIEGDTEEHGRILFRGNGGKKPLVFLAEDTAMRVNAIYRVLWVIAVGVVGVLLQPLLLSIARELLRSTGGGR
jgi:hypothetical protein